MTLTNQQQNIIETLMPIISKHVINGMSPIDALREAMNYYNEFACEIIENQTNRTKIANQYGAAKCYQQLRNK